MPISTNHALRSQPAIVVSRPIQRRNFAPSCLHEMIKHHPPVRMTGCQQEGHFSPGANPPESGCGPAVWTLPGKRDELRCQNAWKAWLMHAVEELCRARRPLVAGSELLAVERWRRSGGERSWLEVVC